MSTKCSLVWKTILAIVCLTVVTAQGVSAEGNIITLHECVLIGIENSLDIALVQIDLEQKERQLERANAVGLDEFVKQANQEYEAAVKALDNAIKALIGSIEQRYYGILHSKDSLSLKQKALEDARTLLVADELKFNAGLISSLDIESTRLSLSDFENDYRYACEDFETTLLEFYLLLGKELPIDTQFARNVEFKIEEVSFDEAYATALEHRSDIASARNDLDEAEKMVKYLNNPFSPAVEIEKAEDERVKASIRLQQVERSVMMEVRQVCFSIQRVQERIVSLQRSLELAKRETEAAKLKYNAGLISSQQLLDAQDSLLNAEKNLLKAKWDYNGAKIAYMKTVGLWSVDWYLTETTDGQGIVVSQKRESGVNE